MLCVVFHTWIKLKVWTHAKLAHSHAVQLERLRNFWTYWHRTYPQSFTADTLVKLFNLTPYVNRLPKVGTMKPQNTHSTHAITHSFDQFHSFQATIHFVPSTRSFYYDTFNNYTLVHVYHFNIRWIHFPCEQFRRQFNSKRNKFNWSKSKENFREKYSAFKTRAIWLCTQRYFLFAWNKREKKSLGKKYHAKVNLYAKNILHLLFFSVFIFFSVVTWAWQYRCFFFICMSLVVRVLSVCTRLVYPSALNFALCHSFVVYIGCAAELCACWHFGFWQ